MGPLKLVTKYTGPALKAKQAGVTLDRTLHLGMSLRRGAGPGGRSVEWGKSGALSAVKGPRAGVIPGWASTEWSLQSLCVLTPFKGKTKRMKKTYYFESSPHILLFYLSPLPPTGIFISPKTVWDDNTVTCFQCPYSLASLKVKNMTKTPKLIKKCIYAIIYAVSESFRHQ